jgi:hypothetical protein
MLSRNRDPAKRSQYRRVDQDEESWSFHDMLSITFFAGYKRDICCFASLNNHLSVQFHFSALTCFHVSLFYLSFSSLPFFHRTSRFILMMIYISIDSQFTQVPLHPPPCCWAWQASCVTVEACSHSSGYILIVHLREVGYPSCCIYMCRWFQLYTQ